ncbi:MAG: serine hydrolase domain-containing protein [Polyangiales bacterium]
MSTRVEGALREELERGVASGVFPGASACVGFWQGSQWHYRDVAAGVLGAGLGPVQHDSFYDLASLTKPFVAAAALRLHQTGAFPLDARVAASVPEAASQSIGDRTWEEVLSHRSGLEAWVPFYESLEAAPGSEDASAWLLAELLPHWDHSSVGAPVYSDLGYMLAGVALGRSAGVSLPALVAREVTKPLGIQEGAFYGVALEDDGWKQDCAPTGYSPWRDRSLRGEVHDDNCAALGGVAGHAGMFGRAYDVARFGAAQVGALAGRLGALEEERVRHAVARRPGGTHRLGWDGKADEGSSAGRLIDADAFGHLGFTGTSLWCDPRREVVVALLTNRVTVSDDNAGIRAFRPRFHDALFEVFDGF